MALSACNRICTLGLAALVAAGCASGPQPRDKGEQAPTQQQPSATEGLTQAQQSAFDRGAQALAAGNADSAVSIFEKLVESKPELAAAHANLGTALMMREDEALARSSLQRAVALDPSLVEAQLRLGVLHRRAGNFEKAEAAYKAALEQAPDHRNAHLNLGILYDVYLQRPQQALEHYQRFQELSDQPDKEVATWIADLKQRL